MMDTVLNNKFADNKAKEKGNEKFMSEANEILLEGSPIEPVLIDEEKEEREGVEEEIKTYNEVALQKLMEMNPPEEEEVQVNQIIIEPRKSLNWREINKRLIRQRQRNFSRIKYGIILCYCALTCQIIFFEIFNWSTTMKFIFNLPYLGFNVYNFDVGTQWTTLLLY